MGMRFFRPHRLKVLEPTPRDSGFYELRVRGNMICGFLSLFMLVGLLWIPAFGGVFFGQKTPDKKQLDILFSIYNEVKELGRYAGDNFINREFHIDVDGRRQNSEEFVVVLIHDTDEGETMILELTYFDDKKTIYSSKYVHEMKRIACELKEGTIRIVENSFGREEMEKSFPVILEGIVNKKKLLEVLNEKSEPSF